MDYLGLGLVLAATLLFGFLAYRALRARRVWVKDERRRLSRDLRPSGAARTTARQQVARETASFAAAVTG